MRLTPREKQIFNLACDAKTNADIARRLGIHLQTVKDHMSSILAKAGVKNRVELLSRAIKVLTCIVFFLFPSLVRAGMYDGTRQYIARWERQNHIALRSDETMTPAAYYAVVSEVMPELRRLNTICPKRLDGLTVVISTEIPMKHDGLNVIRISDEYADRGRGYSWQKGYIETGARAAAGDISGNRSIASTTRHEVGHIIMEPYYRQAALLGQKYGPAWIKENVSEYALKNSVEFAAESFSTVMMPGYIKGTLPEDVEALVWSACR